MTLELGKYNTVQLGLAELLQQANSMQQNLQARVDTPVLEDNTNLWSTWLDSKTIQLYGGVNADQRHIFKIDHEFDLSKIVSASISSNGSVRFEDNSVYQKSEGTEFVIIPKKDLLGAEVDYVIRTDKYAALRAGLDQGNFSVEELAAAGAFKINCDLTPKEVLNDGWKELAVGKTPFSETDYNPAIALLQKYITKARENNCFTSGKGMGFYVRTDVNSSEARPWYVDNSNCRSNANDRDDFDNVARFLRVRRGASVSEPVSAAGGAQNQDLTTAYTTVLGNLNGLGKERVLELYSALHPQVMDFAKQPK